MANGLLPDDLVVAVGVAGRMLLDAVLEGVRHAGEAVLARQIDAFNDQVVHDLALNVSELRMYADGFVVLFAPLE